MRVKLLKMARRLWACADVHPTVNRKNQLKWARAVHRLGDKWLLARHQQRSL